MSLFRKAANLSHGVVNKASDLSGHTVDKVDHMVLDDLLVKTIMRVSEQKDRVNKMLEGKGSDYRIVGIEVDDRIPPKVVFITKGPE
jgi:hypothetical protein